MKQFITESWPFIFILILFGAVFYLVYQWGYETGAKDVSQARPDTVKVTKCVDIQGPSIPVYKYVKTTRTQPANIDSIFEVAKEYWRARLEADKQPDSVSFLYMAIKDTSYADSLISGSISYCSPLPLHPDGYFNLELKAKRFTEYITQTITESKHFTYGLYCAAGYGVFTKKPEIVIGLGIGYSF